MNVWYLFLFLSLGMLSIVVGVQRRDIFDIGLGVAVMIGGSLVYATLRRQR